MSRFFDTLRTANANLGAAKLRTVLTVLSLVVGAFTLTLGLGVGSGLNNYVADQVGQTSAGDPLTVSTAGLGGGATVVGLTVEEYDPELGASGTRPLDADDLDAVRAVPGVDRVEPVVSATVEYLAYGDQQVTASVAEVPAEDPPALAAGDVAGATAPGGALIGHGYLQALGIASPQDAVGQTMNLVILDQLQQPRQWPITVSGVTSPSLVQNSIVMLSRDVLIEMQTYQASGIDDLLNRPAFAVAYLTPGTDAATVQDAVDAVGLSAETAEDQAASVGRTFQPIQLAVLGFSLIAIGASVFGIVNTLLMSVNERTREIGLLKALGSRDRHIFGQFLAEALALGLWGGLIGMVLAVGAGFVISEVVASSVSDTFPGLTLFSASPATVLGAPLLIGAIAVLAGTLPARRAMRLDPITALRYE